MPKKTHHQNSACCRREATILLLILELVPDTAKAAPLDYFLHSAGPASRPTMILGWVFAGICVLVCVIVAVLLGIAIFRERRNEDTQSPEAKSLEWVYIGTALSTVVLFAMGIYAFFTLNEAAHPAQTPLLSIKVIGYQWWWKVIYDEDDPAKQFITANEIHIPVGVPVQLKLESADVIHAFWVPRLAGKTQMIPGLINQQWIEADKPGTYRGQCTIYCGVQHAHMAFTVIAEPQAAFDAWQAAQRRPATRSSETGASVFSENCGGCHTIRGSAAMGEHAPDLTHLASRQMLAAGLLTNNSENIENWIQHAQELKPGARMPDTNLDPKDLQDLMNYLSQLK